MTTEDRQMWEMEKTEKEKEESQFRVVVFEDNTFAAVPVKWINVESNTCAWPNHLTIKQFGNALLSAATAPSSWKSYELKEVKTTRYSKFILYSYIK